jgi:AmmeMemoRadiSam system protein B
MPPHVSPDRPKLRYGLAAEPHLSDNYVLYDPLGIGKAVVLSALAVEVAERFEGELTAAEIAVAVKADFPRIAVSAEVVAGLAAALDGALLLDSPQFRERLGGPVRKPACIGTYSADPTQLRAQLAALFTAPGGAGLPQTDRDQPGRSTNPLRAVLVPHMDYARGNVTYGHGFRELIENTDARVFVVVATSHYSPHRFILSRQHFETPLGLVETDQDYVERIASHYGDGLFDDPLAHVPEHSIELEVVLLQYLLAGRRPFKIVPLLTGSIGDCVRAGETPAAADDVARMVAALRAAEAACAEPVCYVISGDLAHIGPKFDDKRKAAGPWLDESREKDGAILKTLEAANPAAFFDEIAAEKNARRICGLPPTWLTLEVTKPRAGKVLHYQQYVHPQGHESVSFAAAAFYG